MDVVEVKQEDVICTSREISTTIDGKFDIIVLFKGGAMNTKIIFKTLALAVVLTSACGKMKWPII